MIRNVPSYRKLPERPVGPTTLVHYHGVVVPGRGLEILIGSVALWHPQFRLRIRGPASPDYIRTLMQRAAHLGVSDRITFEAAVPAGELIERAADVMLKERRKLILLPRETPMSLPQLRNMVLCAEAGARLMPAMPAFYQMPQTLDDLANFMAGKLLAALGFEHELYPAWKG